MPELDPGRILEGRYEIVAKVGSGGEADLYRARDLEDGSTVALKMLRLVGKQPRRRFLGEFDTLSRLRHPRIVRPHWLGIHSGKPYFSMDFICGRPLSELIARPADLERLRTTWLLPLVRQVGEGLAHIHEKGMVHRDVKPANIMVSEVEGDPEVTLVDLSLARPRESPEDTAGPGHPVTPGARPSGTAEYMSPEQVRGLPADERSDLYSMGVVLYEILAGKPPFAGENKAATMTLHLKELPRPLRPPAGGASSGIEAAVMRLLEKEPADRYGSVASLLRDLPPVHPSGSG